jgi:hypothetical protein
MLVNGGRVVVACAPDAWCGMTIKNKVAKSDATANWQELFKGEEDVDQTKTGQLDNLRR